MIKATKKHFNDMNEILEQYAHLDYRNNLYIEGIESGGVFELLLKDINKLRDAITEMLVENKSTGLTLQNSFHELLQNVDNLNKNSNSAATAINEAITVIDQIVFQTNILSLNAAVEATTVGKAGKGFVGKDTIKIDNHIKSINKAKMENNKKDKKETPKVQNTIEAVTSSNDNDEWASF